LSLSLNRLGNEGLDVLVDILETGALGDLERLDLGARGAPHGARAAPLEAGSAVHIGFVHTGSQPPGR
jgi:hypothetical protein